MLDLADGLGSAERGASQLDHALGNGIHVTVDLFAELVEQFVDRDELRTLQVPMGLLRQQRQVDPVRQAGVEQLDRHFLRVPWQVVLGLMSAH